MDSDFKTLRKLFNPKKHIPYGEPPNLTDDLTKLARYSRPGFKLSLTLSMTRGLEAYEFLKGDDKADEIKAALVDTSVAALTLLNKLPDAFLYPDSEPDHDLSDALDNYYSFFGGDLDGGQDDALWVRNGRFVNLMCRRHDQTEEIIQIMQDRKTLQPESIEAVLDFDSHQSLKGGAL
jgi:hypothetical protein